MASVNIAENTVTIEILNNGTFDLKRFYTVEYLKFCGLNDNTEIFINTAQKGGGQPIEKLTIPYRYFAYVMSNYNYAPNMFDNTNKKDDFQMKGFSGPERSKQNPSSVESIFTTHPMKIDKDTTDETNPSEATHSTIESIFTTHPMKIDKDTTDETNPSEATPSTIESIFATHPMSVDKDPIDETKSLPASEATPSTIESIFATHPMSVDKDTATTAISDNASEGVVQNDLKNSPDNTVFRALLEIFLDDDRNEGIFSSCSR